MTIPIPDHPRLAADSRAGCGKTTYALAYNDALIARGLCNGIYVTFAKANAEELATRACNLKGYTYSALGNTICRKSFGELLVKPKPGVNPDFKIGNLTVEVGRELHVKTWAWKATIKTIVDNARQDLWFSGSVDDLLTMAENRGILLPEGKNRRAFEAVLDRVWNSLIFPDFSRLYPIDFQDMMYLPLLWKAHPERFPKLRKSALSIPSCTHVILDETQDSSAINLALVELLLEESPGAYMLAVYDDLQNLYGWRGAFTQCRPELESRFGAFEEVHLTTCYRCSVAVCAFIEREFGVKFAPGPNALPGAVRIGSLDDLDMGDAALAYLNSDCVMMALKLLRKGKPFHLVGNDLRTTVAKIYEDAGLRAAEGDLRTTLSALSRFEEESAWITIDGERVHRTEATYRVIKEQIQCLRLLLDHLDEPPSWPALECVIDRLLAPAGGYAITVSTVHKAKGLEWENVYFHSDRSEWHGEDVERSVNVPYVACTRAKNTLYLPRPSL